MDEEMHPSLAYEPETGAYRLMRPERGNVTVDVIRAIAELTDTDPIDMTPAYDQFDPDVLEGVYESCLDGRLEIDGRVVLSIADHRVTIADDGTIRIHSPS